VTGPRRENRLDLGETNQRKHGNSWKFMEIHGNSWKFMEIHGNSWKFYICN